MVNTKVVCDKNSVVSQFEFHLDSLSYLVDKYLIDDGCCDADSQKVCLINRLNNLQMYVNGIEDSDLIKN